MAFSFPGKNIISSMGVALYVNVDDFNKQLNQAAARWEKFGTRLSSAGFRMSLGLSVPLISGIKSVTDAFSSFESEMTRILNLTEASETQVSRWGKQLTDLAPKLGKAPQELAEGLYYVASASEISAKTIDIVTESAKASAIGLGSTANIAKLVTASINAYGAENLTATQAVDVLAATIKEGALEIDALATSMGRIIPVAGLIGVKFTDLGAAIATASRSGQNAEQVITGLRGLFNVLLAPAEQSRKALVTIGEPLDELERQAAEAQGAFNQVGLSANRLREIIQQQGLVAALRVLQEAFQGNYDLMKRVIPNIRAITAFAGITVQGDTYRKITERIERSNGLVESSFKRVQSTLTQVFAELSAQFQVLLIEAGGQLAPMLKQLGTEIIGILGAITKLVAVFSELPGPTRSVLVTITALAIVVGPLALLFGQTAAGVAGLVGAFRFFAPIVSGVAGSLSVVFGAAGLVVAGTAVAAALAAKLYTVSEEADAAARAAERMGSLFAAAGTEAKNAGTVLTEETQKLVEETEAAIRKYEEMNTVSYRVKSVFIQNVQGMADALKTTFVSAVELALNAFKRLEESRAGIKPLSFGPAAPGTTPGEIIGIPKVEADIAAQKKVAEDMSDQMVSTVARELREGITKQSILPLEMPNMTFAEGGDPLVDMAKMWEQNAEAASTAQKVIVSTYAEVQNRIRSQIALAEAMGTKEEDIYARKASIIREALNTLSKKPETFNLADPVIKKLIAEAQDAERLAESAKKTREAAGIDVSQPSTDVVQALGAQSSAVDRLQNDILRLSEKGYALHSEKIQGLLRDLDAARVAEARAASGFADINIEAQAMGAAFDINAARVSRLREAISFVADEIKKRPFGGLSDELNRLRSQLLDAIANLQGLRSEVALTAQQAADFGFLKTQFSGEFPLTKGVAQFGATILVLENYASKLEQQLVELYSSADAGSEQAISRAGELRAELESTLALLQKTRVSNEALQSFDALKDKLQAAQAVGTLTGASPTGGQLETVNQAIASAVASQQAGVDVPIRPLLDTKAILEVGQFVQDRFQDIADGITNAFKSAVTGIIQGTLTLQEAMTNIAQSIVLEWAAAGVKLVIQWIVDLGKMLVAHIATQAAMGTATQTRIAADIAGQTAATGITVALKSGEVVTFQLGEAAKQTSILTTLGIQLAAIGEAVAANAAAAVTAIWNWGLAMAVAAGFSEAVVPIVGPALAVAAIALVLGIVGGLAAMVVSSAAGGAVLGSDGPIYAHAGEMILPRHLSEGIQDIIEGRAPHQVAYTASLNDDSDIYTSSESTVHLHVHAVDGESVRKFFQRNGREVARTMREQTRNFSRQLAPIQNPA